MQDREATPSAARIRLPRLPRRQWIKVGVYSLLLVNFGFYLANDLTAASHTVQPHWTLLDWARAFATTLDEAAWFVLLFLFELETYLLSDEAFTRWRLLLMHGLRIVCYLFIGHTVYAYAEYVLELAAAAPAIADDLCALADADLTYVLNLTYTPLDGSNCRALSTDSAFYLIRDATLVTDSGGLRIELELALIDVFEVLAWLGILFAIEASVLLQSRGITESRSLRAVRVLRQVLYAILWLAAAYWLYRGHWVFAWDEALWILGFIAIDMNIDEWRQEIDDGQSATTAAPVWAR